MLSDLSTVFRSPSTDISFFLYMSIRICFETKNLTTATELSPSLEATGYSANNKFPAIFGAQSFVVMFPRAYPEINRVYTLQSHFLRLCNIILPSIFWYSFFCLYFRFYYQNSLCVYLLCHKFHLPCPSHPP